MFNTVMRIVVPRLIGAIVSFFLAAGVGAADSTVFVNVNVLSMQDEKVLPARSVLVRNGRIAAIAPVDELSVPEKATLVDGTDRYLMPGLAEMHAHVTSDSGFDRLAILFVANGVTTLRGMLGQPAHLDLRERLLDGRRFGPRLVTSGPSLNGRSVSGARDAAEKVRQQHAAGYDFIKVHPGLTAAEFQALAETANALEMPFAGHVPAAVGVAGALAAGMASIDHLDGYFASMLPANSDGAGGFGGFFDVMLAGEIDDAAVSEIVAATAAGSTWNVPTETLIEALIDPTPLDELRLRPEMRYVDAAMLQDWLDTKRSMRSARGFDVDTAARAIELRRRLIAGLHAAGAGILLGSDAPQRFNVPGFSLHRELKVMVDAGMSPYAALRAGTLDAAAFLGTNAGSIEVGRDADLLLLDANPLLDIDNSRRIHGVMVRGTWYGRADLDARLKAVESR